MQTCFTVCTSVDSKPRLHAELVLWVVCATRWLPRAKFNIVVYFINFRDDVLEGWIRDQGVEIRHRSPPVPNVPHCNRLAAFLDSHQSESVIATDSDLFFVRDPSELLKNLKAVRAAPNNACNPPPYIFKRLLAEAGLDHHYRPTFTLLPGSEGGHETHINNISAGIIALPAKQAKSFATSWAKWAIWLNERKRLLDQWAGHIDQIAFALTCEEESLDVVFLPPQVNLIMHLLDRVETIYAFHLSSAHIPEFPGRFRADKTIDAAGLRSEAVLAVEALNASILEASHEIAKIPTLLDSYQMFLNPHCARQ